MPKSHVTDGWAGRGRLAARLDDVTKAREHLRAAQGVPHGGGVHELRVDLIAALEAYADAITRLGAPLPRGLRAEIDLQRRIGQRR